MLQNIQAYFRTFGTLTLIFYLFFILKINYILYWPILTFIFIYIFIVLYLTYFIYSLITKKNKNNYIHYISILKDKEFIMFKDSLFNIYYSLIIILFIYLFKHNMLLNFYLLWDLNIYFVLFIFLFCLFMLSNSLTLFLFNFYLNVQNCINMLNDIKFDDLNLSKYRKNIYSVFPFTYLHLFNKQARSFSTFTSIEKNNINENKNLEDTDPEIENYKLELKSMHAQEIKILKKAYGGGYLGYTKIHNFGNVSQFVDINDLKILQNKEILITKLKEYVIEIPENVTYSVLPVLRWESSKGYFSSLTVSNSIKIIRNINIDLLSEKIIYDIFETLREYSLRDQDLKLFIMGRPWLSVAEFKLDRILDRKSIEHVFDSEIEKKLSAYSKTLEAKDSSYKMSDLKYYLYKDIYMDNYGDPIYDKSKNLVGYKIGQNEFASIYTYYNSDNLLCNKVSIKSLSEIDSPTQDEAFITWIDIKTESGFVREYKKIKYYYDKNNNLLNRESTFTCSPFPKYTKDTKLNDKIGTIDFETFGSNLSKGGMGYQQVYAGGWAVEGETKLFYKLAKENSEQFINRIFLSIFMNYSLNGYTFYAHNLGRFDSIFIIKSLILNKNIEIIPIWKDNSILSLTVKCNDFKIVLLDSLQLISGSLDSILKYFHCETQKGYFPYSFVNKDNLYYIGNKPSKEKFKNISDLDYNNIPEKNWDLRKESLKYLKSDIEGLLEALIKFRDSIYSKYNLNITKYKTISGLALAAYCSSYLPDNLKKELKMVKGGIERKLRTSYFGDNVDVIRNKITTGYYYDVIYQYPAAMMNDMPVGEPILSLETDLSKIFGFVYCEIFCPDEQTLQVPFIQYRDHITKNVLCPRGKFKRLIFSEEAKYALKFGYKVNVEYCYQFKRGQNLFTNYVKDHYKIKSSTKDPIQKSIANLFLNSLYGRLGIKDIENTLKIVDKKEAEYLDKNTNVTVISELTENKYMVRYNGQISDNIRKLYSDDPWLIIKNKTIILNKEQLQKSGLNKKKSIPAAVHIAAAISSYARIIRNEFKNIPGNPCIMSDTESVVLTYPLPDHYISGELGYLKLEHKIKKGIFIRKNLYYILTSDNKEIIKSSGIDSSRLNYNSFIKLLKGESLTIERTKFNIEWNSLNVNVVKSNIVVQGLQGKIKTIENTPDVKLAIERQEESIDSIVYRDKQKNLKLLRSYNIYKFFYLFIFFIFIYLFNV